MMKFAYFYFQATGEIMKCMFAGLDDWGNPVWVVTEPGRESLSFREYYERNHVRWEEDHFLFVCHTWDKTTTWLLGRMLADRMKYRSDTAEVACRKFIKELERYHIKGDGTRHYLKVSVEKKDDGCYQYTIQDVNTNEYLFDDECNFDNLVDLIDEVRTFLRYFYLNLTGGEEMPFTCLEGVEEKDMPKAFRPLLDCFTYKGKKN